MYSGLAKIEISTYLAHCLSQLFGIKITSHITFHIHIHIVESSTKRVLSESVAHAEVCPVGYRIKWRLCFMIVSELNASTNAVFIPSRKDSALHIKRS